MTTECHRIRSGFTLAEAVMALVILGFAAAGVLLPFAAGASVQAEGARRTLAAGLAHDLMERIVNTPFDEIVDTWNGYSEAEGQLLGAEGQVLTDPVYGRFSREVNCDYAYMSTPPQGPPYPPNFILTTVEVHYRGAPIAALHRLVSE